MMTCADLVAIAQKMKLLVVGLNDQQKAFVLSTLQQLVFNVHLEE